MSETKRVADWELIERHYRAGIKTLRQIATEGGVTEGAIRKRAKRDQWSRNLKAKIQARAEDLVRKEMVRKPGTQLTPITEKETVEVNAQATAMVLVMQKGTIARSHRLLLSLFDELELTTGNRELFESLGKMLDESGPDQSGSIKADKINEIYRKVISMPGRFDCAKKLVEMIEKTVRMEREAFGIDSQPDGDGQGLEAKFMAIIKAKEFNGCTI